MTIQVQELKTSLAKLLATENLTVEHANVPTAYFDVKNRVLVCPQFKNMNSDLYDLFIGHEVSHALHTPQDGLDELENDDPNYFSFVNVVEDARIERFIQKKYPGLKKCFYTAYGELMERDFFGLADKNLNELLFIDRLNLKTKLGTRVDLEFNEIETEFYNRSLTTTTFDEVLQLTNEIWDYCQTEMEEKQASNPETIKAYQMPEKSTKSETQETEEMTESEQGSSTSGQTEETDDQSTAPSETQETEETDQTADESKETAQNDSTPSDEETDSIDDPNATDVTPKGPEVNMEGKASDTKGMLPRALTDMHSINMDEFVETDNSKIITYVDVPKTIKLEKFVVPFNKIHSEVFDYWNVNRHTELKNFLQSEVRTFKKKNEKIIAYLHKEFEMKKAAEQYARATSSKTGVINTNKLFSYKYNEDLFKKVTSVPNGKNHGMTFFLDWSGSMSDNMMGTIEQLLCLVLFCRKANIPFSVYAFSSEYEESNNYGRHRQSTNLNEACLDSIYLLQFFHEKMNTQEFNNAVELLIGISKLFDHKSGYQNRADNPFRYLGVPRNYYLGGTPLDGAIIIATELLTQFQKKTGVQIMNAIFLTDGSSHAIHGHYAMNYAKDGVTDRSVSYQSKLVIRDKKTNTQIMVDRERSERSMTKGLYSLLKKVTGVNLVGFHIAGNRDIRYVFDQYFRPSYIATQPYDYIAMENQRKELRKQLQRDKSLVVKSSGLDELYIIKGGKDLQISDEGLQVSENASKAQLTTAFKKMNKGKLQNRVVLGKFVERIAA